MPSGDGLVPFNGESNEHAQRGGAKGVAECRRK
jgi:hypothetical protein